MIPSNWLEPSWIPGLSLEKIPVDHFIKKGLKAIILDVDGTLIEGKELKLNKSIKDWVENANNHLKIHLLSNNPSKKRISSVAKQLNIEFTYGAAKPRVKSLRKVLNHMDIDSQSTAIIGDRIFTDIIAGNRLGLYTVLVRPITAKSRWARNQKIQKIEEKIAKILGAKNL